MRYYLDGTTLFLRGHFTVAVQHDPALLTVPLVMITTAAAEERERAGELTAAAAGMVGPAYTLFSAGRIVTAAIARCDQVTACVHAGPASVSMVIVVNRAGPALLNGIRKTAAAAINKVLEKAGMPEYTVEVAAATEEEEDSPAGPESEAEVTAATTEATETALFRRSLSLPGDRAALNRPAFSIHSRFGGDHWVAWQSKDCPYYPCHMKGQSCRYCYCPFYPCEDDELGQQVISSTGKTVWNCSGCMLVHEPAVAAYLQRDPMASLCELKQVHRRRSIRPE
ncbi:cysteine-rich small domain-containing protein [Methanosphaerula subterraneus]|uniref:cysteine-rich small domain-containing protein n=1 Tax=Methanosphaerula subterraneus TaxID=3350244 RepID=UPI003F8521B1